MNLKLKLSKYFLLISILSFVALFVFILQSGYSNIIQNQSIQDSASSYSNQIIDTEIDISVIDKIKTRNEFDYQPPPVQIIDEDLNQ